MTPRLIRSRVISERSAWIRDMLEKLKSLPLESFESFISDRRNPASAESYLRRALEALLDLGRHILPKDSAWLLRSTGKLPKDSSSREY